jgi:hypothetical protein
MFSDADIEDDYLSEVAKLSDRARVVVVFEDELRSRITSFHERNRLLRAKRRLDKTCVDCGLPLAPCSRMRCSSHLAAERAYAKQRMARTRAKRKREGQCTICGAAKAPSSRGLCQTHIVMERAASARARERKKLRRSAARAASA